MHRVFAYGSNMCLVDLARWLDARGYPALTPLAAEAATLDGWRLVWNYRSPSRDGGAANVERCPRGGALPGVLLTVCDELFAAIDHKEGHPDRYRRRVLPVRRGDGRSTDGWVYVVTDDWRQPADVPPRRAYLDVVLRGARAHRLPAAHLTTLAGLTTLD